MECKSLCQLCLVAIAALSDADPSAIKFEEIPSGLASRILDFLSPITLYDVEQRARDNIPTWNHIDFSTAWASKTSRFASTHRLFQSARNALGATNSLGGCTSSSDIAFPSRTQKLAGRESARVEFFRTAVMHTLESPAEFATFFYGGRFAVAVESACMQWPSLANTEHAVTARLLSDVAVRSVGVRSLSLYARAYMRVMEHPGVYAPLLGTFPSIEKLSLRHVRSAHFVVAQQILAALGQSVQHLEYVSWHLFHPTQIASFLESQPAHIPSQLKSISFDNCRMGEAGPPGCDAGALGLLLGRIIAKSDRLEDVRIDGCELGDSNLASLFQAIARLPRESLNAISSIFVSNDAILWSSAAALASLLQIPVGPNAVAKQLNIARNGLCGDVANTVISALFPGNAHSPTEHTALNTVDATDPVISTTATTPPPPPPSVVAERTASTTATTTTSVATETETPLASLISHVCLAHNPIGPAGTHALACGFGRLRHTPHPWSLSVLCLSYCLIDGNSLRVLLDALCESQSRITSIDLRTNPLGTAASSTLALFLLRYRHLAHLKVAECGLGHGGFDASFGKALSWTASSLVSLDLSGNRLGDDGCRIIADAIRERGVFCAAAVRSGARATGSVVEFQPVRLLRLAGNRLTSPAIAYLGNAYVGVAESIATACIESNVSVRVDPIVTPETCCVSRRDITMHALRLVVGRGDSAESTTPDESHSPQNDGDGGVGGASPIGLVSDLLCLCDNLFTRTEAAAHMHTLGSCLGDAALLSTRANLLSWERLCLVGDFEARRESEGLSLSAAEGFDPGWGDMRPQQLPG